MKKIIFKKAFTFLIILLTILNTSAQEFEFEGLGILNNIGDASSKALDVSADGSVVTGITTSTYEGELAGEAYRWENGVMSGIGFYNPSTFPTAMSYGTAISGDGTFIVGYTRTMESQEGGAWETFLWMQGEGMMGLGGLEEPPYSSEARGVSDDGQVVVGRDFNSPIRGFRWANGTMEELTDSNGYFIEAWGVSADGSVVVGSGFVDEGVNNQAVLWKEGEGISGLHIPEEQEFSSALGVSADGTVAVGYRNGVISGEDMYWEAFKWTEESGMVGLGYLDNTLLMSEAKDVSDDGSVVVGFSNTDEGTTAFIWSEETGMLNIQEILENNGIDMTEWKLTTANGVSADGKVIVGNGINPQGKVEAWRAVIPFIPTGGECTAPNTFLLDETTDTSVMFSWEPSPSEVNGYYWQVMELGGIPGEDEPIATETTEPGITSAFAMGLSPGTSYNVYIQTICSEGELSSYGGPFMISTTGGGGECIAPNMFFLDETTDTSAMFSWEPSPSEVNGYYWQVMELGGIPGEDEPIATETTEPGMTSAFAVGLNPGTSYNVYIQTICSEGELSSYGGPFMITTTGGGGECIAPNTFLLDEITDNSVLFSWEPSPSEVNGYYWQVMDLGGIPGEDEPLTSGTTEPGMTSAFAMGLNPGTSYNVYIQTICSEGELSSYGGPFMITTTGGGGECEQPSDITVNTVTNTVVFVSWTENGDATEWEIEYGESGFTQGEGTIVMDNDGMPGETIGGLTQGVEYDVYVRAICEFSESDWEGPVVFVIEPEPCSTPSDIIVDNVAPTMVYVSWTENGDATEWEIEYGESGFTQGEGTIIIDNDGTPGEAISGLQAETGYDAYVRAICEFSASEWMGPTPFTTEEDLGTTENAIDNLVLYPNPTTGIINIKTEEPIERAEVYTITGSKLPVQLSESGKSIDISDLSTGIYFVRITANNQSQTYKIIKE